MSILWVAVIALLASVGQVMLKLGVSQTLEAGSGLVVRVIATFTNPWVVAGISIYAACAVLWLYVISRLPLSIAYPMLSLTFLFVPLFGYLFFGEALSVKEWAGLALLIMGIIVFYL